MHKYNGYLAIFIVFFMVFLGIRIPGQNHKPGPKRKARAVITQTTNKNLSVSIQKYCKDPDITTPVATLSATLSLCNLPSIMTLTKIGAQTPHPQRYLSLHSSRAPPRRS